MGNTVFKCRIKQLREQKGFTMDSLAKELGIQKSRISMWENNGSVPRQEMLFKLSELFDVSTDYLLGNDSNGTTNENEAQINRIQRGLEKLDVEELGQAEDILKTIFKEKFNGK